MEEKEDVFYVFFGEVNGVFVCGEVSDVLEGSDVDEVCGLEERLWG